MKASKRAKKQNRTAPMLIIGIGVLLVITVIFILALNAPTTTAPQGSNITIPLPNIERASLEDAKRGFDSGTALFLDIRDTGSFASGHIEGAINIPLEELEGRVDELPKDRWIITYCT